MKWRDPHKNESSTEAWKRLNDEVAKEIKNGTGFITAPRIIAKKRNPAKVVIGWFERRRIRGEIKRSA